MSFLTAAPPNSVVVGGKSVPITTSFRAGIQFELQALGDQLTPESILSLFYGASWPRPYDEAIQQAIWFYRLGKPEPERETKADAQSVRRSYDFELDADALYTSFRSTYGIDLLREDLHWWAFRELMIGLPDDTAFKQRVYYRIGSTEGMTVKQKKRFEALRAKYAIPARGRIDKKPSLAERDDAMKRYVARRFEDVYGKADL